MTVHFIAGVAWPSMPGTRTFECSEAQVKDADDIAPRLQRRLALDAVDRHHRLQRGAGEDAGDIVSALTPLTEPLGAYDLDNAQVAHKQTYRINANWKLVLENYLECYHCATSHRAYAKLHTLKDLDEKSRPIVNAMLERADEVRLEQLRPSSLLPADSPQWCAGPMPRRTRIRWCRRGWQ